MSKPKTILITGSTDGIGKELALSLVNKNYKIIIHGRDQKKGYRILDKLKSINPNCETSYINADFSKIDEINTMADELLEQFQVIDILVNNAGTIEAKRTITDEGFEKTFVVNHLSMFLLTLRILPLLQKTNSSRIINVSSQYHNSSLDLHNLQGEKQFTPTKMYSMTKLLNILFTFKLSDLLSHTNITVNCIHPGVLNTKLLRVFWNRGSGSATSKTLEFMVTSPELEKITGKYYRESQNSKPNEISYDKEIQDKIWELSETFAKIKFNI